MLCGMLQWRRCGFSFRLPEITLSNLRLTYSSFRMFFYMPHLSMGFICFRNRVTNSRRNGYGSIPIHSIFSGLFTSINPSYFDVNKKGVPGVWPIPKSTAAPGGRWAQRQVASDSLRGHWYVGEGGRDAGPVPGRSSTLKTPKKKPGAKKGWIVWGLRKYMFYKCCFTSVGPGDTKAQFWIYKVWLWDTSGAMFIKQTILKHKNLIFWNCGESHEIFRDPACFFGMWFQEGWRHVKRLKDLNNGVRIGESCRVEVAPCIGRLYGKASTIKNNGFWLIAKSTDVSMDIYKTKTKDVYIYIYIIDIYIYIHIDIIYLGLVPKKSCQIRGLSLAVRGWTGGFVGDIHGRHQGSSREGCEGHTAGGLRIVDFIPSEKNRIREDDKQVDVGIA